MQPPEQSRGSEHADPHEQHNPVPRVMLGLVLALVVWAIAYIFTARPDGMPALGDQRPRQELPADGRGLFVARCQACHQANGQGLPGVFPPLAGASWVTGDPGVAIQIVLHGLIGPIDVNGVIYQGAMPAFGEQMNDAELAALLSFIRSAWGNAAPAVEADAVRAARAASAARTGPWQGGAELESMRAPAVEHLTP